MYALRVAACNPLWRVMLGIVVCFNSAAQMVAASGGLKGMGFMGKGSQSPCVMKVMSRQSCTMHKSLPEMDVIWGPSVECLVDPQHFPALGRLLLVLHHEAVHQLFPPPPHLQICFLALQAWAGLWQQYSLYLRTCSSDTFTLMAVMQHVCMCIHACTGLKSSRLKGMLGQGTTPRYGSSIEQDIGTMHARLCQCEDTSPQDQHLGYPGNPGRREGKKHSHKPATREARTEPILLRYCSVPALACVPVLSIGPETLTY